MRAGGGAASPAATVLAAAAGGAGSRGHESCQTAVCTRPRAACTALATRKPCGQAVQANHPDSAAVGGPPAHPHGGLIGVLHALEVRPGPPGRVVPAGRQKAVHDRRPRRSARQGLQQVVGTGRAQGSADGTAAPMQGHACASRSRRPPPPAGGRSGGLRTQARRRRVQRGSMLGGGRWLGAVSCVRADVGWGRAEAVPRCATAAQLKQLAPKPATEPPQRKPWQAYCAWDSWEEVCQAQTSASDCSDELAPAGCFAGARADVAPAHPQQQPCCLRWSPRQHQTWQKPTACSCRRWPEAAGAACMRASRRGVRRGAGACRACAQPLRVLPAVNTATPAVA